LRHINNNIACNILNTCYSTHKNANMIMCPLPDTICYDDGCHLKKYASKRADLTQTSKKISSYNIVIDKMHFKGHVDEWCHTHCNPYQPDHLNGVSLVEFIYKHELDIHYVKDALIMLFLYPCRSILKCANRPFHGSLAMHGSHAT
jgi:hypothetical protein